MAKRGPFENEIDSMAKLLSDAFARRDARFFASANRKALNEAFDLVAEACTRIQRTKRRGASKDR